MSSFPIIKEQSSTAGCRYGALYKSRQNEQSNNRSSQMKSAHINTDASTAEKGDACTDRNTLSLSASLFSLSLSLYLFFPSCSLTHAHIDTHKHTHTHTFAAQSI